MVDKKPPASAGDMGSILGLGRFHVPWSNSVSASRLLSLNSGACEPQLLKPVCLDLSSTTGEARVQQPRVVLLTAATENPHTTAKTQCSQINTFFKMFKNDSTFERIKQNF